MPELMGSPAASQEERIAALVSMVGGPVRAAAIIGKTRTHVDNMRKPGAPLRLDDVLALARAAGVPLDWVVNGGAPAPAAGGALADAGAGGFEGLPGFIRLTPLRPEIVTTGGRAVELWRPSDIAVSVQWLDALGLGEDSARYGIAGDGGMAPLIGKGAMVMVDARPAPPRTGVYLVGVGEELLARRLARMPDGSAELIADADPRWRYRVEGEVELYRIVWVGQGV